MLKRLPLLNGAAALGVAAGAIVAGASAAQAGGFALREQSAYSQGASFAGAATCGESIQGAFWNPSVITCADGLVTEGSWSLILPSSDITTDPYPGSLFGPGSPVVNLGDPGDIGRDALVPSSTAAFQFNDRLYFGVSVNGGFGLKTKTNFYHAAQNYGRTSEVFSLNAQPIVGYRINDMISVAAGLQIQYFDVRLTSATATAQTAVLSGDDVAVGATAGILFTPMTGTEIGLGYRSGLDHSLEGDLYIPGTGTLPIDADVDLPQMVSLGVRHRVTDAFTLLGTIEWTNWDVFSTFPVTSPAAGGAAVTVLPFEWDDGWFYSVGGEYRWNEQLTLRAGVAWEESPISDEVRAVRLPDNDRLWLSVGATYKATDSLTLNAGYTYIDAVDTRIDISTGNPAFVSPVTFAGEVDSNVHIFSVGMKYAFHTTPEPAPMEEIVYKP